AAHALRPDGAPLRPPREVPRPHAPRPERRLDHALLRRDTRPRREAGQEGALLRTRPPNYSGHVSRPVRDGALDPGRGCRTTRPGRRPAALRDDRTTARRARGPSPQELGHDPRP